MTHPTFEFLLDAWRYLRSHNLVGLWRPEKVSFTQWRLVEVTA